MHKDSPYKCTDLQSRTDKKLMHRHLTHASVEGKGMVLRMVSTPSRGKAAGMDTKTLLAVLGPSVTTDEDPMKVVLSPLILLKYTSWTMHSASSKGFFNNHFFPSSQILKIATEKVRAVQSQNTTCPPACCRPCPRWPNPPRFMHTENTMHSLTLKV